MNLALDETQRYLFDLRGYLVIRGVLDDHRVAELNDAIDAHGLPEPTPELEGQLFGSFLAWGAPFRELIDHEVTLPMVEEIIGTPVRIDRYYGIRMATDTSGLPLHGGRIDVQDGTEFFEFHDGRFANGLTTVSWALCDMQAEHGGFACIPGSHKSNLRLPHGTDIDSPIVQHVPLRAGDALVFTGAIAHGTRRWRAPHQRRSLLLKYAPRHLAWSQNYLDWDPDVLASMTPRQRELMSAPRGSGPPDRAGESRPAYMQPGARGGH